MVLMGVEPMTKGWDAWQRALRASKQPLDQTRFCVLVDNDTRWYEIGKFENLNWKTDEEHARNVLHGFDSQISKS